jgi:opacity protein-like surface antigen
MHKYLLAAVAALAVSSPALARDGAPYVGIEGGFLLPRDLDGDATVDFTTGPADPAGPMDYSGDFDANLSRGWDVDAILGYDFGAFRLEGELGWKRAKRKGFDPDSSFIQALNTGLNRPSADPDPGFPGLGGLNIEDFQDLDGKMTVRSGMLNVLLDLGDDAGMAYYGGVGFGRAWARALDDGDNAWALQGILGFRTAVSENIDLGLKYRYFRTGRMHFMGGPIQFAGNTNRLGTVDQTSYATIMPEIGGRFQSHSLLGSLIFNFGAPEPEPVVVAPPPPPPPPPATQTCPDGSVILATDVCPAPPPPPPPAPAGERG